MLFFPLIILATTAGPLEVGQAEAATSSQFYPETRRVEQIDEYHGTPVADPYRWLEADVRESEEVRQWVTAQNEVSEKFLHSVEAREKIERRLTELWNFARYSTPFHRQGKYFFSRNDGLQNQSVLYLADSLNGEPRTLLDPNQWSEDGTVALSGIDPSDDGKLLAYTVSEAGSDWSSIRVVDTTTGEVLDDQLQWVRWGGATWNASGDGFFYARYPEPEEGQQYQALALNQSIYFHRLGTKQEEDQLVFRRPDHPDWSFWIERTDDDQFLVLQITKSTDDINQVWYQSLRGDTDWVPLIEDFDNQFEFIGNEGRTFFFLTDLDSPRKRVVAMDLDSPGRDALRELIPQAEETLEQVSYVNHQLIATYLKDATTQVRVFSSDGNHLRDLQLPGLGTAAGFGGRVEDQETFYIFYSYNIPPSIYRVDLTNGESAAWKQSEVAFDPNDFEVNQVFYPSKDGTRVPMFIGHRKDMALDAQRPTLLYGYGGFNISLTPRFNPAYILWMEMGGAVAVPNLRGGGEYGEQWHLAGKKLNKQNVFDDFIAAAEYLIQEKYTSAERLAIQGRSNGGLLVGAVMTQRPELFGACLPGVGVMDMLRYQQFTAGRFWVDEYGTADNEVEFRALLAYSPYHNLKPGVSYPATLVTTADTDDRVVPMHSFKFAAALQHAQASENPTLIRIETRAGHGAGTPTAKIIENLVDELAFLVRVLKMEPVELKNATSER